MIKLSAHLGYQFTEFPFDERFAQAAAAGYKCVEFPFPRGHDIEKLADLLASNHLSVAQITTPNGNAAKQEKGLAALPDRINEFRAGLHVAVRYAKVLGCDLVHPMAGVIQADNISEHWHTYIANLRYAVDLFADNGVRTLVEVISDKEVPGYYIADYEMAAQLFDAIPDTRLCLLFDTYHAQLVTQDVFGTLDALYEKVGHVQIADWPGRHEPGTGQLDFGRFFQMLGARGYPGRVGCEYRPLHTTIDGLKYLAPYLTC